MYKKLTDYERAECWTKIESEARHLGKTILKIKDKSSLR